MENGFWSAAQSRGAEMRVGIDLRAMNPSAIYRGIGKYVMSLSRALSEIDDKNEYYLFLYSYQAEFAQKYMPHGPNWHFVFLNKPGLRKKKFIRTIFIGNPSLKVDPYQLDVIFQLDKNYPVATQKTPVVSIIYDLIPQLFKSLYQPPIKLRRKSFAGIIILFKEHRLRQIMNRAAGKAHRSSSRVIVISEHTGRDVAEHARVSQERIVPIPLGAETIPGHVKSVRPNNISASRRHILYVGGTDPRKRLPFLVEQFATLANLYPNLDLVIAGSEGTNKSLPHTRALYRAIKRTHMEDRVILTGYIDDPHLAYLYEHAVAFVFPSQYEGFGLPILEAFLAGCPVITYDNSSLPEVAGDAALVVPDGEPIAPAIEQLLNDAALRNELIEKGKKRARDFTWEKTARETLDVLEQAGKTK